MNTLTAHEKQFVSAVQQWMNEAGDAEFYVCGATRGVLHIDEDAETLRANDEQSMRTELVETLLAMPNTHDARVSAHDTLNLIHQVTKSGIRHALIHSADESTAPKEIPEPPAPGQ